MRSSPVTEQRPGSRAGWPRPTRFHTVSAPLFPVEVLAPWQADFVLSLSRETQTPPDLAGSLVLSVTAASCAKKMEVEVRPGWVEPVNVYTVTSLPPGNRKSAAFAKAVSPFEDFDQEENRRVAPLIREAESKRRILEQRLRDAELKLSKSKGGDGAAQDEVVRLAREVDAVQVPVPPRKVVDDCSPEKLVTLLRDHGGCMALLSAEGDIFGIIAGRYTQKGEPNLGVFLKAHAGDTLRIDRVNRPSEHVHRPALTIGLTVQPDVLRGLAKQPTLRGRGLLGRILYSVPRSLLGERQIAPTPMSNSVRAEYSQAVQWLLQLPFNSDGFAKKPHLLRLDREADTELQRFEAWLEPQLGEFGELASMSDWAGKLAGAVVRIAGLLHLADHAGGPEPWKIGIPVDTIHRAICLGKYYLAHARVAFAEMGADTEVENAKYLLRWVRRAGAKTFTQRDAFQGTKGRFKQVVEMDPALTLLAEHNYIRRAKEPGSKGRGRPPSPAFGVNPYLDGDFEDIGNIESSEEGGEVSPLGNIENIEEAEDGDTAGLTGTDEADAPPTTECQPASHNSQNPQNSVPPPPWPPPCDRCFGTEFWTTIQGPLICTECCLPTDPRSVQEWIIDGEHLSPAKMRARERRRSPGGVRR